MSRHGADDSIDRAGLVCSDSLQETRCYGLAVQVYDASARLLSLADNGLCLDLPAEGVGGAA